MTYLYASIPIFKKDWKKAIQEQKMALDLSVGWLHVFTAPTSTSCVSPRNFASSGRISF